ncbi:hypothetical protein OA249_01645 [Litorivicinus sp.]|nr:hypothetical protein [Litorivicinus sp.]
MRYFDLKQSPIMINQDGIVHRLDTNHLLVEESVGYHLSEEAIELTEVSFLRRFSDRLAPAFIHSLDSEIGH